MFYIEMILGIALNLNLLTMQGAKDSVIKYENKEIVLGQDNIETVRQKFEHRISYDYESRFTAGDNVLRFIDIKEKSIYVNKAVVTPTIFFEFSKDSVIRKMECIFFIDGPMSQIDYPKILEKLTNTFPALAPFRTMHAKEYIVNKLRIKIDEKKVDDNGLEIIITAE